MTKSTTSSILGLSPLLIFLVSYLASSLLLQDFYAMPLSVAFVIASTYAIAITPKIKLEERIRIFTEGASDTNIMTMIWIFVLAGAFAEGAKTIGAIDASVSFILSVFPSSFLLPALFIAACLISLSVGTSVGTIIALAPIALGFSEETGLSKIFLAGLIAGGAFFGDNLSFISDTTIAATRTQGVNMRDKFAVNFRIVLPAAIICLLIYVWVGKDLPTTFDVVHPNLWLLIPYAVVIITALMGLNVLLVLLLGILSCGLVIFSSDINVWDWVASLGKGITAMGELIIVTLLAGGMLALIRYNGGIDFLLEKLTHKVRGKRGGEIAVALLVTVANICTANNTIAILTTGGVAKDISTRYHIDPRRTASILDTFSCMIQGLLPYGAQLLLASGFASVSPISIISYMYYPILLGLCTSLAILLRYPRKFATNTQISS